MKKRMAALALAVLLTGCVGADGEIPDRGQVLDYVDEICAEPYREVSSELVAETPDDMEYRFETDRGLRFTAHSYLSPIYIDASKTSFYSPEISCDYVSAVHDLYRDDVKARLARCPLYREKDGWMAVLQFSDLDTAADAVIDADQVYAAELAFNSPEFLAENPVASIHVAWYASEEAAQTHEDWVNITDLAVTGQNDREALYGELADQYAQLCVDGKITDSTVPAQYLADKHVSSLDTLELNGRVMTYDLQDNPVSTYGLTTDDYCYAWYSREKEAYLLPVDVGFVTESSSFPLINREYVKALGGHYTLEGKGDRYLSSWTIGPDTWRMETVYKDGTICSVQAEKNGQPLELDFVTVDEDSHVGATFCAGLSAGDFCKLFDLQFEADESARTLRFTSK